VVKRVEFVLSYQKNNDVSWIKNEVIQTINSLRRIVFDLRPTVLDDLGLVSALKWFVDRIITESGINIHITICGDERKLPSETEIAIFRMVQEALNNITQHSNAKNANVTIKFGVESLDITIHDDGQGILPIINLSKFYLKGKWGLIGIKERAEQLGGICKIDSNYGEGTQLSIKIKC
jgi:signal transduction histidine kinase